MAKFWGTTQLTPVSEFYITPFFEPVWYNRVLVNWPRAHCGVLQLTEASYLGPDSPRTSPWNETVKQCNLRATGLCNLEASVRCKPRVGVSVLQCTTIPCLFSVFSNINGEHESTLTTSKKYSWCIPVQKEIKPIIWGAAITPEPWNRQLCWFIFKDPNVRVARLLRPRDNNKQDCFLQKEARVCVSNAFVLEDSMFK